MSTPEQSDDPTSRTSVACVPADAVGRVDVPAPRSAAPETAQPDTAVPGEAVPGTAAPAPKKPLPSRHEQGAGKRRGRRVAVPIDDSATPKPWPGAAAGNERAGQR